LETPENLHGLLLAINKEIADRIDYKHIERVERTFIESDFRKREADMLFKANFRDDEVDAIKEVIIYVLIEHQSSVDPIMPFRILYYVTQIWESQRREWESQKIPQKDWRFRPILPVVFYTGKENWNQSLEIESLIDLPSSLESFVPQMKMLFFNLKATSEEQVIESNHPFGWILQIMQKEDANFGEFSKSLQIAIRNLDLMSQEDRENWAKLVFFIVEFIRHRRNKEEQPQLFDIVEASFTNTLRQEEVKSMMKTGAQALLEEGREEGLELGIIRTKQQDLIRLLTIRFESIPQSLKKKIKSIKQVDRLNELFDHAIKAHELSEIERLANE
jgi:predicted transposase YdaD